MVEGRTSWESGRMDRVGLDDIRSLNSNIRSLNVIQKYFIDFFFNQVRLPYMISCLGMLGT